MRLYISNIVTLLYMKDTSALNTYSHRKFISRVGNPWHSNILTEFLTNHRLIYRLCVWKMQPTSGNCESEKLMNVN